MSRMKESQINNIPFDQYIDDYFIINKRKKKSKRVDKK